VLKKTAGYPEHRRSSCVAKSDKTCVSRTYVNGSDAYSFSCFTKCFQHVMVMVMMMVMIMIIIISSSIIMIIMIMNDDGA